MSKNPSYVSVTINEERPRQDLPEFGSVLIFGCSKPAPTKLVDKYENISQVFNDFDDNTEEYIAAAQIFGQYPGFKSIRIAQVDPEIGARKTFENLTEELYEDDYDIIYFCGYRADGPENIPLQNYRSVLSLPGALKNKACYTTVKDADGSIIDNEEDSQIDFTTPASNLTWFYQRSYRYEYSDGLGDFVKVDNDEQPGAAFIGKFLSNKEEGLGKKNLRFYSVAGVTPITDLMPNEVKNLQMQRLNYYTIINGKECFAVGRTSNNDQAHLVLEKLSTVRLVRNTIAKRLVDVDKMLYDEQGKGLAAVESMVREGFEEAKKRGYITKYSIRMPTMKDVTPGNRAEGSIPFIYSDAIFANSIEEIAVGISFKIDDGKVSGELI